MGIKFVRSLSSALVAYLFYFCQAKDVFVGKQWNPFSLSLRTKPLLLHRRENTKDYDKELTGERNEPLLFTVSARATMNATMCVAPINQTCGTSLQANNKQQLLKCTDKLWRDRGRLIQENHRKKRKIVWLVVTWILWKMSPREVENQRLLPTKLPSQPRWRLNETTMCSTSINWVWPPFQVFLRSDLIWSIRAYRKIGVKHGWMW